MEKNVSKLVKVLSIDECIKSGYLSQPNNTEYIDHNFYTKFNPGYNHSMKYIFGGVHMAIFTGSNISTYPYYVIDGWIFPSEVVRTISMLRKIKLI